MNYIIIDKNTRNGLLKIHAIYRGVTYADRKFSGYTEREAVCAYRKEFDLVGRHFTLLHI